LISAEDRVVLFQVMADCTPSELLIGGRCGMRVELIFLLSHLMGSACFLDKRQVNTVVCRVTGE
jgi:hypothetical protein